MPTSYIYKSVDDGAGWEKIELEIYDPELRIGQLTRLDLDVDSGGNVYVLGASSIYASTDGGKTWEERVQGLPKPLPAPRQLVIDPTTPATLYFVDLNAGLFKSVDAGRSWVSLETGLDFLARTLAIDPRNPLTVYAASPHQPRPDRIQVVKSVDGGQRWQAIGNAGLSYHSYEFPKLVGVGSEGSVFLENGILYRFSGAEGRDVWRSLDGAGTAQRDNVEFVHPGSPDTVYFVNREAELMSSVDQGATWRVVADFDDVFDQSGDDLDSCWITALAVSPTDPETLYGGVQNCGEPLLKSVDGGETWINPRDQGSADADE